MPRAAFCVLRHSESDDYFVKSSGIGRQHGISHAAVAPAGALVDKNNRYRGFHPRLHAAATAVAESQPCFFSYATLKNTAISN